jgi:hypothetical protein
MPNTYTLSDTAMATYGLVAAGAAQSDAMPISGRYNVVANVAAGSGVVLPQLPNAGQVEVVALNRGANALLIYPFSGNAIESGSVNASVSLAAGSTAVFLSSDPLNVPSGQCNIWYQR